ncbi:motility-associated ABC transporter substrate-binding family protein [Novosphingobium taihuense]|uniref:DUF4350 domain-containing protein n=1 Tax=Novosphingobium taihuense TaxID=260085 RepID=A0A7W7EVN4_9SPHN|nr:DUF4350 domain-containing protein [Novosphingobium taihuense]MBB4615259.1 hypothetical protein [Novosphingobium taihuense]TWH84294.1 hypothetical protein IQ25_02721 [Novosphingobium taihuense]
MGRRFLILLLIAVVASATLWAMVGRSKPDERSLGLFTSLPIVWNEAGDLKGLVDGPQQAHWARAVLERHGHLVPLDTLLHISRIEALVIAQPRPLMPEENVALDTWVRQGGHLLMFADPMLTQESAFALGDRRRPQDVALVSPILGRWGLELQFDEHQPAGLRESAGEHVPVNLAGAFRPRTGGIDSRCSITPDGLIARCEVGKGRAVLVADAAVLEASDSPQSRESALSDLLGETFAD